jgi:hypothetical protein
MTIVSLSLITTWMVLIVLGFTLWGLVHLLLLGAGAIVFLSGNRARARARLEQAAAADAAARG